ncbi:DUF397 domain-containing protein [Streptomyces sp. NPDC020379]|uniref:DUF397 domain-containing protein n=1 Tax=Streptomyces sp. NPDC020379 TaxID=3365071 RepID=UPI0037948DFB
MRKRTLRTIAASCAVHWKRPLPQVRRGISSAKSPNNCEGVKVSEMEWQKSSYSSDRDDCIEVGRSGGRLAIRESDVPGAVLITTGRRLGALIQSVKLDGLSRPI